MSEKVLDIENLHVTYRGDRGEVYAVNGISLHVDRGKTLGLVGETGAGKTTTALSILRLLPKNIGFVDEGSIRFEDMDLLAIPEKQMRKIRGERISMIFQDPMTSLNPVLTVEDQLRESIALHEHCTRAQLNQRVDEMMEMVGIRPERKAEYPHQFSGGMKQRIVIAMALACKPRLLIADEPTTALDVTIQAQVLEVMNELKQRLDTAMILITHDLGVVVECCDDVAIIYAGEIVEDGSVEQIFDNRAEHHPYTIGLFNSIPKLNGRQDRLEPIEGLMPDPTEKYPGCRFAPRCKNCMEICKTQSPDMYHAGTHTIKCHLFAPECTNG